jgi:Virulence factor BrkB
VLLIVLLIGLAVLYRCGPDRRAARWQWVTVGSIFAAVTWIIASFLFSWYLASFANYKATYGSLGAAVGVLMTMCTKSLGAVRRTSRLTIAARTALLLASMVITASPVKAPVVLSSR